MDIFRDEASVIENCRHCQIPMYSVKVEANEVLTGIPNTVLLDPRPKDFEIWEKNPCVDSRRNVWWCPKCYKMFAKTLGFDAWVQVGLILEVHEGMMKYRHKFFFQTDSITTVEFKGDFNPRSKEFGKPFEDSTQCPKCETWRVKKFNAKADGIQVWHWCPSCNEGEPVKMISVAEMQSEAKDVSA